MKGLEIVPISVFKDNYVWLGVNRVIGQAFVVDPGEAQPVLAYLQRYHLSLSAILLTHKHADHTGGVAGLVAAYPDVPVYAHQNEGLSFVTSEVREGDEFALAACVEPVRVIEIPGHTLGHVAYHIKPALFCGDTLFSAGCGRVFEGTAQQMLASLDKLAALPDETQIYCGHEYTMSNLRFAAHVEPLNSHVARHAEVVMGLVGSHQPSLPSTMGLERLINPFLRCRSAAVVEAAERHAQRRLANPADVFHCLREWKNGF